MLSPGFHYFKGKHITSNLNESKNSQVKRAGAKPKQPDDEYSYQLFTLSAFIAETGCLPLFTLPGRPLYKYLMRDEGRKKKEGYVVDRGNARSIQTVLSEYM